MKIDKLGRFVKRTPKEVAMSFWERVEIPTDLNDCWLWRGAKMKGGYGMFSINRRKITAHQYACFAKKPLTEPLPRGYCVMHLCDTPACCNPNHLKFGTLAENRADCVHKRRHSRGETHGPHKLKTKDVIGIRREFKALQYRLAEKYGVNQATIYRIMGGNTWRDYL
jgi:hypothetical protein